MKKRIFIGVFTLSILALVFVITKPEYVKYQAEVTGVIINENGKPISNAKISRIEEKINYHPEFGYEVRTPYKSDKAYTDENGKFTLKSKSELIFTWNKGFKKDCDLNLQIEKNGFLTYISKENEWNIENAFDFCNQTMFKLRITLKRSE